MAKSEVIIFTWSSSVLVLVKVSDWWKFWLSNIFMLCY